MKISVEKINSEPKHSVSKKDIQNVLSKIPFDYSETVIEFKISAQLFSNSKWNRPVIFNNTTFNILSRGLSKREIISELLIEIFRERNHTIYPTYAHKLNNSQRKKLQEITAKYESEIF
jgi:hypothetical protein